jgi:hypothetical protein
MSLETNGPSIEQRNLSGQPHAQANLGGLMDYVGPHTADSRIGQQSPRFAQAETPGIRSDASPPSPTYQIYGLTPDMVQQINGNYSKIAADRGVSSVWAPAGDGSVRQHASHELLSGSEKPGLTLNSVVDRLCKNGQIDLDTVWKAKNEVFARAGRPFINPELATYFVDQGFQPRTNYKDSDMTAAEHRNVEILSGLEMIMRAANVDHLSAQALKMLVPKNSPQ